MRLHAVTHQARCPLMLFVEVKQTAYPVSDALRYLDPSGQWAAAEKGSVTAAAAGKSELDASSRKREGWPEKQSRLKAKSELGGTAGWSLNSMIVKSNDDLRQEVNIATKRAPCGV